MILLRSSFLQAIMKQNLLKLALLSGTILTATCGSAMAQSPETPTATTAATAPNPSPWTVVTEVKTQYVYDDNRDLGAQDLNPAESFIMDGRLRVSYRPTQTFMAYWEGAGVNTEGEASGEDETGIERPSADYLEWRQSWLRFSELGGVVPLSLQVGRQRIREPYSFWWNRDLDAVRLNYDSTLFNGFLAFGEDLLSYRSSEDNLGEDQEERFRVMAEASRMIVPNHALEFRALYEDDHSGTGDLGDQFAVDDQDLDDHNLFWGGVRSTGRFEPVTNTVLGRINYRADLAMVAGSEDMVSTTASADPAFRTITAIDDRDVMGWAFDAGVDATLNVPYSPTLLLGYAYGSGDDGEGSDSSFRQSDIQGNASRAGIATSSIHNYGEVLRPELSNLHVFTAGVGLPILKGSDVTLLYHYYLLDKEETGLRSNRATVDVSGTDDHVGQGLDMVMNLDLNKEIPVLANAPAETDVRISAGTFKAGDAYEPNDDENISRALVQLRVRF